MLKNYINKLPLETKALVTGAKGDVGSAVCEKLRQSGYSVIGVDIEDFDATDFSQINSWLSKNGEPDVLINCTGFNPFGLGDQVTNGKKAMKINVESSEALHFAFYSSRPSVFIDIISNSAIRPRSGSDWYCASKAAQQMMCRANARACTQQGYKTITFGINFGMISDTKNFKQVKEKYPESEAALTCQEAAETIVSLLEATNKSFNGSILTFDAGETFS